MIPVDGATFKIDTYALRLIDLYIKYHLMKDEKLRRNIFNSTKYC